MTLPTIQPPPFGDSKNTAPSQQIKGPSASNNKQQIQTQPQRRSPASVLGTIWSSEQQPISRRERRRAVCSWSFGYGTLSEHDEDVTSAYGSRHSVGSLLAPPSPHVLRSQPPAAPSTTAVARRRASRLDLFSMPGLRSLVGRRRRSDETSTTVSSSSPSSSPAAGSDDINTAVSPLVKREGSCGNLVRPSVSLASLRKCETVLALVRRSDGSSSSSMSSLVEQRQRPLRPFNRLRRAESTSESMSRLCSRCSSLLTLASSSRYSLNASTGGFVPVGEEKLLCKLCLSEVPTSDSYSIQQCGCSFCKQCMAAYVDFEIVKGAYDISCPDAQCASQGALHYDEIEKLVGADLLLKHKKYRLNREVDLDKNRTWCPRAGCETVCDLCPSQRCLPQCVHCPTCAGDFCSNCKHEWHAGFSCEEHSKQLTKQGRGDENAGISFNSDLIKSCPMCNVPIEKDEGCAQMMCKRCKHVFCWYCLASLDDDFLLRHYDKGPCKNKLGHSRASVIWHRTQVIGIFAGFGILLLVASPLLLLAAPCIVCCKCRICNANTSKLDDEDELPDEEDH